MKKINFNNDWKFKNVTTGETKDICLPHDAMLLEKRDSKNPGRGNSAWFAGGCYEYTRKFSIDAMDKDKKVFFELEGSYYKTKVYINGKLSKTHVNGYTSLYIDATSDLKTEEENEIKVITENDQQPNSRWYSGSGLYRPVHMYLAEKEHIHINGIKIKTISLDPPSIEVKVLTTAEGNLQVDIIDSNGHIGNTIRTKTNGEASIITKVEKGRLWSCEEPNLYRCRVTYEKDVEEVTFGLRTIELSKEKGFLINGERVILRGACIHHDNGILGACGYKEADARKVRIMKENGYNAIRSAHNPCSKATLDACDRLGMLVMDEYTDMWYIPKTRYDYAAHVSDNWRQDLQDMVDKDYNHPSVVLYSTGNEVAETSEKRGIAFTGQMTEYLHEMDSSRPVTCGVNIFFNLLYSMGFGVYSEEKAEKAAKEEKDKSLAVGSEFYNKLAGAFGDRFMKLGATLHGCDVKTRDAFANMDVAGYNYGIMRYRHDLRKYPDRFILGSETFCKDAAKFWKLAKENPRIIGDFVWAGMDYLGEVGIGSWEYKDYAPEFTYGPGWISAGSGRVDLIGNPLGEAGYTKVAYETISNPVIAVRPMNHEGTHSPSAWKMTNARESWTWEECEGKKALVEVYARGAYAILYLNKKKLRKKRIGRSCRVCFRTRYRKGTLLVKIFDQKGRELGEKSLVTAAPKTVLQVTPEENRVSPGNIVYVPIRYTDEKGTVKPTMRGTLQVAVEGGTLIALGNACPYNEKGYLKKHTDTYYGEAMAVIAAEKEGTITITVEDGPRKAQAEILCE